MTAPIADSPSTAATLCRQTKPLCSLSGRETVHFRPWLLVHRDDELALPAAPAQKMAGRDDSDHWLRFKGYHTPRQNEAVLLPHLSPIDRARRLHSGSDQSAIQRCVHRRRAGATAAGTLLTIIAKTYHARAQLNRRPVQRIMRQLAGPRLGQRNSHSLTK